MGEPAVGIQSACKIIQSQFDDILRYGVECVPVCENLIVGDDNKCFHPQLLQAHPVLD